MTHQTTDQHPYSQKQKPVMRRFLVLFVITLGLAIPLMSVFADVPGITSSPVTDAVAEQAYTYTVIASGSPAPTFTLTTAPQGMVINENSGAINWTPTSGQTGNSNVTVIATNIDGTDLQSFTINVAQMPAITSLPITMGTVKVLYEYSVVATGNPSPTFTLTTAPTGMTINNVSGLISWEPQNPGIYDVTVEAGNVAGTAEQSFSVVVDAVCPAGMVSYWRLNETSGTTFADYLGTNPATFSGSGGPGFVAGVANGAVDLTGTNQKLSTAVTSNPTSALTLMAWINPDDLGVPDRGIISKNGAFSLGIESDGDKVSFAVRNNGSYFEFEPTVPNNFIPVNKWSFVTATFDGATKRLRIYVNGTEVGNAIGTISSLGGANTAYTLGWDANFEANRFFDGTIDETAVFNRVLTPAEIQLQYSRALAGEGYCDADNAAPNIISTPTTSTVAGLPYTYDVNASGSPGITYSLITPPAGMTIDSVTGVVSWTPAVSGNFTVRVRAANAEGSDTQNYTLMVTAVAPQIISSAVENAITGYLYTYDVDATGLPLPTYALTEKPAGMTINPTTGVISWPSPTTGSHNITVTVTNDGGTDSQSFSISVAEPSSVCPSNMASYWRLDETSGVIFADSYGANNTTFSAGSPSYTTGQVHGAVNFNGTNQKTSSANTSNPTSEVTLMAWINPDNLDGTNDRGIISKNGAFVLEVETAVGTDASHNGISFTIIKDINNTDYFEFEPNVPGNQIPTGTWTHVAATFNDLTKTSTIYINGQVIGSAIAPASKSVGNTISAYNIGWTEPFTPGRYFDGILDEIAVFDEALTLAEIQEIYNNSLAGDTYCEITPKITSQPVTSGEAQKPYTYNVNATGNPAPSFILTNHPSGMTIDANTGIISWLPIVSGTYNVVVEAQNFAGFDEQSFQIMIPDHELYLPIVVRP